MSRRVLITGISGQDGSYLAELAAARGDTVVGLCRATAPPPRPSAPSTVIHSLDLTNADALRALIRELRPDECYHLAAHHRSSQASPDMDKSAEEALYLRTNLVATQVLLAALREASPHCRVLLAGSCHMFGNAATTPQTEETPFAPNTLYGITKTSATQLGRVYRDQHGFFCCTAILYNHESPRRGPQFLSARLARAAVAALRGQREPVRIGNLDAQVDWGYAGDYVQAMAMMLRAPEPRDFIVASGALQRVGDFARLAFEHVGLDWSSYVQQDAEVHRPVSQALYHGDIARIKAQLGWSPSTSFEALVTMMVDHHLRERAS
jgi:GDPmannose 4,6-dehydratase